MLMFPVACFRTSGEQVQLRMGSQGPEAIVLTTEGLNSRTLGHVPDANALVLGNRDDELLALVEDSARNVVGVSSASVNLPSLRFY
jgi:hypothetical protein